MNSGSIMEPLSLTGFNMPVNFSVKNVPDSLAQRLRIRARRNHRSLQQELLNILEVAGREPAAATTVSEPRAKAYKTRSHPAGRHKALSLAELWERARRYGSPVRGEASVSLIRRERDEREGH